VPIAVDDLLIPATVPCTDSVEADPELREVRADDLVGDLGPSDMGPEIPHAGDGAQLAAGQDRDPVHGLERGPRLLDPVHEEIVLLEMGQELLSEERHDAETRTAATTRP
jgi:hypothetical protein